MSQDKIESRRAFMKKLGKVAGAAAVAAAFMATGPNYAEAKPSEDNPPMDCGPWGGCMGRCQGRCGNGCVERCVDGCISSARY